jgi:hypothetical protein
MLRAVVWSAERAGRSRQKAGGRVTPWEESMKTRFLHHNEIVPFTAVTSDYGRASFLVCCRFDKRELKSVYIIPTQQPDAKERFILRPPASTGIDIHSWIHKGVSEPHISELIWCPKHRGPRLYVSCPLEALAFEIQFLSHVQMIFTNDLRG